VTAYTHRNNPTGNCNDGLCNDGPSFTGGLTWSGYVTTNSTYGDTTPLYPSLIQITPENSTLPLYASSQNITGINASISLTVGNSRSTDYIIGLLNVSQVRVRFSARIRVRVRVRVRV
jgi:hypothetical protein